MICVGLMSGTSLDGIDAACLDLRARGETYRFEVLTFATLPWGALGGELLAALPPNAGTVAELARLHAESGRALGRAALSVAGGRALDFVASHGHTMYHDGPAHTTLQIGDAFAIREATCATVCYDFRAADCAAGGHGAPLVPYFDMLALRDSHEDRVALNVGGIANVTLLPKGRPRDGGATAYDTGPGNILLDAFVQARSNGGARMDAGGRLSAAGTVQTSLVADMLADDYFALPAPKTTGRERFGAGFLERHREALDALSTRDGAATLSYVTVESIARAVDTSGLNRPRVLVSGGGAHNAHLMERLAARLAPSAVETTAAMGIPVDAKEAIAFAVLGYETLRERAANVPAATGAYAPAVLGAIAPHRLRDVLTRLDSECSASV